MTALCSAPSNEAVTIPSPVGVPRALQTSTTVALRPPHWRSTKLQVSPRPLTDCTTGGPFFIEMAARYRWSGTAVRLAEVETESGQLTVKAAQLTRRMREPELPGLLVVTLNRMRRSL